MFCFSVPGLEVADAGAEDLRPALSVREHRPLRPCGARTIGDLAGGRLGSVEPARDSASISVMPPVSGTGPGRAHLAHHEHALAAVLLDRDGDLRVPEDLPSASFFFSSLSNARSVMPPALTRPISGKLKRAVGLDGVLAAEIRLVEHLDGQHVLRRR